jgi:UDP-N-acetyl-D-glucosamine dehydrogenase
VGLPLALQFTRAGVPVLGLDTDAEKCARLNGGESYLKHIAGAEVARARGRGLLEATTDFSRVREAEAILICVPTPLKKHREPDLSHVTGTGESIAPHLRHGQLVVLESTTYPGTTEGELRAILERGSGLAAGRDFFLAYSPEREDPGNPERTVGKIPKVVGGLTPACRERAAACYGRIVEQVVPVSSCRVAEATKLLENIFRSVNVALVNELKVVYTAMGIDVWEVIEAAKTKPFGFMPFYPGPGLGGHCIPIDPFYLAWKARQQGTETRFVELAGEVNAAMPEYVVKRVGEVLEQHGKSLQGARILLLGLAYKPNVEDERESPSYVLMRLLEERGAQVDYNDPHVPVIPRTREHAHYAGRRTVPVDPAGHDLALIATWHDEYQAVDFSTWNIPVVDTRNGVKHRPASYHRA